MVFFCDTCGKAVKMTKNIKKCPECAKLVCANCWGTHYIYSLKCEITEKVRSQNKTQLPRFKNCIGEIRYCRGNVAEVKKRIKIITNCTFPPFIQSSRIFACVNCIESLESSKIRLLENDEDYLKEKGLKSLPILRRVGNAFG